MAKPTVVFVPGLWEGPAVFSEVSSSLSSLGYPTQAAPLVSTGTRSPENPSMKDDEAAIRAVLQRIVEDDKDIVLVMHSAGGFLGSAAIEGFGRVERDKMGRKGGVVKLVFLCAGIAPVGYEHVNMPFMDIENKEAKGEMHCVRPRDLLFNDLSTAETEKWLSLLQPQPLSGWNGITTYAGWTEISSVYLICENDQVLPEEYQVQGATMTGSRIERCKGGHMVMLSLPEKVVEVIVSAAGEK